MEREREKIKLETTKKCALHSSYENTQIAMFISRGFDGIPKISHKIKVLF